MCCLIAVVWYGKSARILPKQPKVNKSRSFCMYDVAVCTKLQCQVLLKRCGNMTLTEPITSKLLKFVTSF